MTQNYARLIDHTVLKAETTNEQIEKLCGEAKEFNFASVCVNPTWVKLAASLLKGTEVKVCTVIGFPLGANTKEVKAFEASNAIENGAQEVDMVINIGALKGQDYETVEQDIAAVVQASKGKALVKVIIETSLLTDDEKVVACQLSVKAGADFVKTSTGFSTGGATVEDVALMRKTVGPDVGVKASGGVRDLAGFQKMVEAGATRIGTSNGMIIVQGKVAKEGY
jgi:deoxyribose-phosphate aldolase